MSDAEVNEVDAWVAGYKTFDGYFPGWTATPGRGRDWQARWPIIDANGVISGMACFECDSAFAKVSISIIYRRAPVYRLDKIRETEPKDNPFPAQKYAPHLPMQFQGSHVHAWADHRDWVRDQGLKELPFRRPIVPPVSLEVAFGFVAEELNLTVSPSQRGITLPPQSGLSFDWKGGRQ